MIVSVGGALWGCLNARVRVVLIVFGGSDCDNQKRRGNTTVSLTPRARGRNVMALDVDTFAACVYLRINSGRRSSTGIN